MSINPYPLFPIDILEKRSPVFRVGGARQRQRLLNRVTNEQLLPSDANMPAAAFLPNLQCVRLKPGDVPVKLLTLGLRLGLVGRIRYDLHDKGSCTIRWANLADHGNYSNPNSAEDAHLF